MALVKFRLEVALVGIMLSGAVVSTQQAVRSTTAVRAARAGAPAAGPAVEVTRSLITGIAVDANARPLPSAKVRLRNLDTNAVEQVTTTNHVGEFSFVAQPEVPYVVEIADQGGRIIAVGDVVMAQAGEVAGAVVALPSRLPELAGVLGESAGAVISAATGTGLTVVDPTLPKLSPNE